MHWTLSYTTPHRTKSLHSSLVSFHNLQNTHNSHSYFLFCYSPNFSLSLHRSQRHTDSDSDSDSLSLSLKKLVSFRRFVPISDLLQLSLFALPIFLTLTHWVCQLGEVPPPPKIEVKRENFTDSLSFNLQLFKVTIRSYFEFTLFFIYFYYFSIGFAIRITICLIFIFIFLTLLSVWFPRKSEGKSNLVGFGKAIK